MNSILLRLSDKQMDDLDFIVNAESRTRTEIIREAIESYVANKKIVTKKQSKNAFGLWKDKGVDGLDYQQRIRGEW